MKIQFKITRAQLAVWISFLINTWDEEQKKNDIVHRMIFFSLSALLLKLKVQAVLVKEKYKFSIDASDALAFVAHVQSAKLIKIHDVDQIIISELIGIIDQKTR